MSIYLSLTKSFLFPLLFIYMISLANIILFKKKFEVVLPFSIMESVLVTYIFGFINLRWGFYICLLMALSSIPLLLKIMKKNNLNNICQLCFTDYFWIFSVLYCIVFVLNIQKPFDRWDEYSHWGVMAKEMFRMDRYYYLDECSLMRHKDYPPFTTILEYLWCCLCGNYKERHLYNAKIIFSLSLFLPILSYFFERISNNKKTIQRYCFLLSATLFLLIVSICTTIGEASFYRTIYVETVLASLFLFGIYIVLYDNKPSAFTLIRNTVFFSSFLLVKQVSIVFVLLLILLIFSVQIKEYGKNFYKTNHYILVLICELGIPYLLITIWNQIVSNTVEYIQFKTSNVTLQNIMELFTGNAPAYRTQTLHNFFEALIKQPIINKPCSLSFVPIVLIIFILIIYLARSETNSQNRTSLYLLAFFELVCCICYSTFMLCTYLFGFSQYEAVSLASYNRYMSSMIYPFMILLAILSVVHCNNKFFKNRINTSINLITLLIIIILIPKATLIHEFTPGILCDNTSNVFYSDTKLITQHTPDNAKIFTIIQQDAGYIVNLLAYETTPRVYDRDYFSFGLPYSDSDVCTVNLTFDEMEQLISQYEYLYFCQVDEQFINTYQSLFPNVSIKNGNLYQIVMETDSSFNYIPIHTN